MKYAGFWQRLGAYAIDNLVIFIGLVVAGMFMISEMAITNAEGKTELPPEFKDRLRILSLIVYAAYEVLMTSSSKQGTLGKMLFKLKVVDANGNQLNLTDAIFRYFGKLLSTALFFVGFIMVAFHAKKQGLHDILAKTYVVKN